MSKKGQKKKPQFSKKLAQSKQRSMETKKSRSSLAADRSEKTPKKNTEEKVNAKGKPIAEIKPRGRGDSGMLLTDPHRVRSDLQMLEQAVSKGYCVRRKNMLRRRLEDIVIKTSGQTVTKEGVVTTETKGDEVAIKAANILVMMDKEDMNRLKQIRDSKDSSQPVVNVTVNNAISTTQIDERRIELARLALKLGARELIVEGESVPLTAYLGAVEHVSTEEGTDRTS